MSRTKSRSPTNTESLPLPDTLRVGDRQADMAGHEVYVSPQWWNRHLDELGLPGGPLQTRGTVLARPDVWPHATGAADDDEAALRLLWHSLAWGAGRYRRMCLRRMQSVAADLTQAAAALRRSAALATTNPEAAYAVLHSQGRAVISGLGPAFGTKYLYFAGGGRPEHPSLILDSRVAAKLHQHGWLTLRDRGGWPTSTYGKYCRLARRWADEVGERDGVAATADQVELWLFSRP